VREFGERDPDAIVDVYVGGELIVAAAQVLHERMPSDDHA
jgi:hypothetical protein